MVSCYRLGTEVNMQRLLSNIWNSSAFYGAANGFLTGGAITGIYIHDAHPSQTVAVIVAMVVVSIVAATSAAFAK